MGGALEGPARLAPTFPTAFLQGASYKLQISIGHSLEHQCVRGVEWRGVAERKELKLTGCSEGRLGKQKLRVVGGASPARGCPKGNGEGQRLLLLLAPSRQKCGAQPGWKAVLGR